MGRQQQYVAGEQDHVTVPGANGRLVLPQRHQTQLNPPTSGAVTDALAAAWHGEGLRFDSVKRGLHRVPGQCSELLISLGVTLKII